MGYFSYFNKIPILNFPIKLDIGCGESVQHGFIGIDFVPSAHINWDISKGIPLPDNSCIEIFTSHTLEHFSEHEAHFILLEMFRVSKNECKWHIIVPYANSKEGHIPPHYKKFNDLDMIGIGNWQIWDGINHLQMIEYSLKVNNYSIEAKYIVIK